jgi:hypothetical protein
VAFGKADWADKLTRAGGPLSLCFETNINSYGGYQRVELRLIDWRPDSDALNVER